MLKLLSSFGSVVISLVTLITSTFKALFLIILNIPIYVAFLVDFIAFQPSVVQPFMIATISLYVIFFILNREHSK